MSNRSSSKQHGMHRVKRLQPSSTPAKKRNKANNRAAQQSRQAAIAEALAAK